MEYSVGLGSFNCSTSLTLSLIGLIAIGLTTLGDVLILCAVGATPRGFFLFCVVHGEGVGLIQVVEVQVEEVVYPPPRIVSSTEADFLNF